MPGRFPGLNTALQMARNVLEVLGLLAVDITREIEVELVFLDFR